MKPYHCAIRWAALACAVLTVTAVTAVHPAQHLAGGATLVRVIVSEFSPETSAAENLVLDLHGHVARQLPIVDGFAADVPAAAIPLLRRAATIREVWADAPLDDAAGDGDDDDDDEGLEAYDGLPPNRVWRQSIGLDDVPADVTGAGVTVAILDTGLTRTPDLGDRVLARVDLTPDGHGYDRYGHGTHMAGVVAGNGGRSGGKWRGVAPGAWIVSVKVAGWNGATDVSAVLAGLEWIAVNRERYGIRVLSLSYGTESTQKYQVDPLNLAVERLWRAGILVVAAAGNRGAGGGNIDKPGDDPYVVTVGAADVRGTADTFDDTVAPFSSRGPTRENVPKPDLVAPGITIVSQRAPDSTIDAMRPAAGLDEHYFKGTGTSQATAIVAGTAALMFQAAPALTPNEAKATLVGTASADLAGRNGAGAGLIAADEAVEAAAEREFVSTPVNNRFPWASGGGAIDSSRGGSKPYADLDGDGSPEQVSGEIDVLGNRFDSAAWSQRAWNGTNWRASPWAPLTNVSPGWSTTYWPPDAWGGMGWDEPTWSARSWRDAGLDPSNWTARSWRAELWN